MLVELSNYSVPQQTTDCFTQLGDRGITAVITHPERNPILRESPQRVVEWAEQGCVIQMTGSALTGFWGERVRRAALWLLEHDAVHVLATDAHDTEKRIPVLSTAREAAAEICGEEVAEALVEANPAAIIKSQPSALFSAPRAGKLPQDARRLDSATAHPTSVIPSVARDLVFARGSTGHAGTNQDPSLRSG